MIFGFIGDRVFFSAYPEPIQKALNFLCKNDINQLAVGEYEIEGRDIFVRVVELETKDITETRLEYHKKYIDVQFVSNGVERLGFIVDDLPTISYSHEKDDLYFCDNLTELATENFLDAKAGCFTIFFPGELHRPAVVVDKSIKIKKAIVKVNANLLCNY